jgi:hypothetical protein
MEADSEALVEILWKSENQLGQILPIYPEHIPWLIYANLLGKMMIDIFLTSKYGFPGNVQTN